VTDAEVLACASRRERELYGDLVAAYRALADVLGDAPETCDMDALVAAQARADVAAAALRATSAIVGPIRLAGEPVAAGVREDWETSAALAAEAATLNVALLQRAGAGRSVVGTRLGRLAAGRRGTTAYGTSPGRRLVLTDARA
jgi:hypothetical protein